MAQFRLEDYETVEERIRRFYKDNPDGRIVTKNKTTKTDRAKNIWVVKAEIWLPFPESTDEKVFQWSDNPGAFLKATGYAFEVDGTGGANKTSALENAETSAIGRALANAGYSGNKRASREEMEKVVRMSKLGDLDSRIEALTSKADARALWVEANKAGASPEVLVRISAEANRFE